MLLDRPETLARVDTLRGDLFPEGCMLRTGMLLSTGAAGNRVAVAQGTTVTGVAVSQGVDTVAHGNAMGFGSTRAIGAGGVGQQSLIRGDSDREFRCGGNVALCSWQPSAVLHLGSVFLGMAVKVSERTPSVLPMRTDQQGERPSEPEEFILSIGLRAAFRGFADTASKPDCKQRGELDSRRGLPTSTEDVLSREAAKTPLGVAS